MAQDSRYPMLFARIKYGFSDSAVLEWLAGQEISPCVTSCWTRTDKQVRVTSTTMQKYTAANWFIFRKKCECKTPRGVYDTIRVHLASHTFRARHGLFTARFRKSPDGCSVSNMQGGNGASCLFVLFSRAREVQTVPNNEHILPGKWRMRRMQLTELVRAIACHIQSTRTSGAPEQSPIYPHGPASMDNNRWCACAPVLIYIDIYIYISIKTVK